MNPSKTKITRSVSSAYQSFKDSQELTAILAEMEREIERALIKTIHAPIKKAKLAAIKKEFESEAKQKASHFQSSLKTIDSQLDQAIRGRTADRIGQEVHTVSDRLTDF